MENSPFYIKQTEKAFDLVVEAVKSTAKQFGFNTLAEHQMHNTFEKNSLEWAGKYTILAVCNPHKAHHALSIDLKMGCFMPKNIIIFEDDQKMVNVMFMKGDPEKMNTLFPGKNIGELSTDVRTVLINIINESI